MAAPSAPNPQQERAQLLFALGACACALAGLFVFPLALGAGIWYLLRYRLGRREWVILLVAAAISVVFTLPATMGSYFHWYSMLVFGGNRLAVPFLALAALATLVAGVLGVAHGTPVQARVMDRIRPPRPDDLLPTASELSRIETVARPIGDVVVSQESHSLISGGEPGQRSFPIGVDRTGRPAMLSEDEIKTHMVVLGSTGSGKTETLKNLAGNLMDLGWQVVTVDLKEDTQPGGLRDFLRDYAQSHALPYQELAMSSPSSPSWFNPLLGMSVDEAINTIMSLQSFEAAYYEAINKRMIGQITKLFYDAHAADPDRFPAPDMYSIGKVLSHPDLKAATKEMRATVLASIPGRSEDDFASLSKPSEPDRQTAPGLGARITNMYESDAGRIVLRHGGDRDVMDVTRGGVAYIGLNTLGLSELARVVSTSVLLRLATLAGARTTGAVAKGNTRIAVIIDEANWIDRKNVQNLLSRARSAGITVILATQGANDWNDENGQDWEKIVNNVNVGIIMRQGGPESAELCAEYIGKKRTQKVVNQIREGEATGSASVQEVEDYHISPDGLRNLLIGQAIVRVGTPQFRLNWVKVAQRDPHLHAGGLMSPRPDRPTTRTVPRPPMMKDGVSSLQQSASVPAPSEPPTAEPPAPDDDGWVSL